MDDRKDELEKKRAKLAELRRAREERRLALMQAKASQSSTQDINRTDLDNLVNSLVGARGSVEKPDIAKSIQGSPSLGEPSRALLPDTSVDSNLATNATVSILRSEPETNKSEPEAPKAQSLTSFSTIILDLPPKEKLVYNKSFQTSTEIEEQDILELNKSLGLVSQQEVQEKIEEAIQAEKLKREAQEAEELLQLQLQKQSDEQILILNEEEQNVVLSNSNFLDFFEKSSRLMERALDEDYDITIDYSDSATNDRNVMAPNDSDGLVAVWNVNLKSRPEYTFCSPSDVLKISFNEFDHNMVIGSTYSGQIMIWDTRTKLFPVLKTLPGAYGHTQPVYSLKLVGTKNAHQLVTCSSDGQFCSWQLDMLAQPIESITLHNPNHSRTDEVGVTCLDFSDNESSSFYLGTQEGDMFNANRYDRAGTKAGLVSTDIYRGHSTVVSGLHIHPLFGPTDFSDVLATSSFDYTCKLWRPKSVLKASNPNLILNSSSEYGSVTHGSKTNAIMPIHTLDVFEDYVYDVKWSPVHPSVLATADGTGNLSIFDLNEDTQIPMVTETVNEGSALSKIAFNKTGKLIAAGSVNGNTTIYDLGEFGAPKQEDFTKFSRILNTLTAN
ncbi:Cytoplasmic dynein 1 intermediate chain 1 [Smittium mucronatum]|uniref:Cytoplasmic dynein 1 intermediate chain 1 n=1 Tax=Smittium mucronatum TaxID=133383 RepID=A0A1R0GNM4_9FUNG|nr:Cytoplasmic dynein 1 intermediate chain 1 [Smittium mucronatum]